MAAATTEVVTLPRRLAAAIEELDPEQRSAVIVDGNLVITAGPGSGKTRTVVARAGFLLATQINSLRGLATISYTNQAASELREGLSRLGVDSTRRLFAGTMHSFCLAHVLPYAPLVGVNLPPLDRLMTYTQVKDLEQEVADALGVNVWALREVLPGLRRRMAAGEDVSAEPERYVRAVTHYEELCERRRIWDFDGIVLSSVRLLEDHPEIAEVIQAKFPVVMIDEYQDLGAGLHRLVQLLLDSGVEITAVGDVDQSIFGFNGGDPAYLEALCEPRSGFTVRRLVTNYRCGSAVVAAAELTFDRVRGYRADPSRSDPGVVEFQVVEGATAVQAEHVVTTVREFIDAGLAPHEIAVLVRNRKPLVRPVVRRLIAEGIAVHHGSLATGPATELGRWLEVAALYATSLSELHGSGVAPEVGANRLLDRLESLRRTAGEPRPAEPRLARLTHLHATLVDQPGQDPASESGTDLMVHDWLPRVVDALGLEQLAQQVGDPRSSAELADLLETPEGIALTDLASDTAATGKVVISTFHGAKGRTFSAVVIPGLTEGAVPPWTGPVRSRRPKTGRALDEERRGFYVALTRSRGSVVLQVSSTGVDHQGYEIRRGYSSFAVQLAQRLGTTL